MQIKHQQILAKDKTKGLMKRSFTT
uniref:Uncharacterized protein n=1 Tax=Rhizophora mucronata TaxID=61149 RepID=A0A2P2PK13_RHIMU